MGMAPVAHVLFTRYVFSVQQRGNVFMSEVSFFNANPKNSKWFNRDRFVLSNGYVYFLRYSFTALLTPGARRHA